MNYNKKISIIAAVAQNGVIGKDNDLVWHLPDDMRFFSTKTKGHIVVMGRKNWDSIPLKYRPLPNRENIILTRNKEFRTDGAEVFDSLEKAIIHSNKTPEKEIFIIGGSEIYKLALPYTYRMYLTEIAESFEGDTYFPEYDKSMWKEISRIHHPKDEKHASEFDFVEYLRKG